MIKAESIDRLREVGIYDVVGKFVDLKKKGNGWEGCCPFHEEKTPSFRLSISGNYYKCFGCGVGGGALKFVMELEKLNFYEACVRVADIAKITLEMEEVDEDTKKLNAVKLDAIGAQELVLNTVVPIYQKLLFELPEEHDAKQWLRRRGFDDDLIVQLGIGWGGEDWHFITPVLINGNMFDAGAKLGLLRKPEDGDRYYDVYRCRVTIPMHDKDGRCIGIAGAWVPITDKDKALEKVAKYINPGDCEIYNKSKVLFGLNRARKAVQEAGMLYLVEGYMDCISVSRFGLGNVAALCGTALTAGHISLIKRFTNYVALWLDNDNAGHGAMEKHLPELLKAGLKVGVAIYDGKDPDEWVMEKGNLKMNQFENLKIETLRDAQSDSRTEKPEIQDGVMWFCERLMEIAGDDAYRISHAKNKIYGLLTAISDVVVMNHYKDVIIKRYKWKAGQINNELKTFAESSDIADEDVERSTIYPTWVNDEQKLQHMKQGYLALQNTKTKKGVPMYGYYNFGSGGATELTNFVIKPLFMVDGGQEETRYLVEIKNGYIDDVLDVPAKAMVAIDMFQGVAVNRGNFVIHTNKQLWLRIASDLLQEFPRCKEVRELGWQRRGVFCYVDRVYIPGVGLREPDEWGIFRHDEVNMLIPASSKAYKKLEDSGVDPFENDRYLNYKESKVGFEAWAILMQRVYEQKGVVGVAYAILTIFRDVVFEIDNNCPHLYAFGEPSSGKSKWVESITAIFYYKRAAFNLNSGTDFSFSAYMRRFINCPAHLNEFDIEVIKPEWFQQIKGVYDGESRERGKLGSRHATEIMKVLGTLILTGQKLVTADDNSVVTRSIIEPFSIREGMTDDDKKAYDDLKELEGTGLNGMLVDVLAHRVWFAQNYRGMMNKLLGEWRRNKEDARLINQRILLNWAHVACCYSMMAGRVKLPQAAEDFVDYCFGRAKHWHNFIKNTDTLSDFWGAVEFMANRGDLLEGWHFIITEETVVQVRVNRDEVVPKQLGGMKKVLYIRLKDAHQMFSVEQRKTNGKTAMNLANMLHYFSSRAYFVGAVKDMVFTKYVWADSEETKAAEMAGGTEETKVRTKKEKITQKTSCYAFVYDELPIEIARQNPGDEGGLFVERSEEVVAGVDDLPF